MSRAVILQILLSGTLIMAAVLPETTERPSPTPEEGVTSLELLLKDLALPAEVISETLFNQVDNLQDLLEQCEGTVRNHLLVNSPEIDDDDNFISAEIDDVLTGHRPGNDTEIPASKLSTANDTGVPQKAADTESKVEGVTGSAASEAAALIFPELFGESSNTEAGVTREAAHKQVSGSGWNGSSGGEADTSTQKQKVTETAAEGGGAAREDWVSAGLSTPVPDSAREDREVDSDDDDDSHDDDENSDSYEEDEEDVDYDDDDDSDDSDSDDDDVSDSLEDEDETASNETISKQAENEKELTNPADIPTEISKLHADESSGVPAQVPRAKRSASRDDTRLGLGELRENGRVRRSAFWDDSKTDVLGMPGSWPAERRRGDNLPRRWRRNAGEAGSDPKRYLPLINRLVDRFNYLKGSLAACRGLLNR